MEKIHFLNHKKNIYLIFIYLFMEEYKKKQFLNSKYDFINILKKDDNKKCFLVEKKDIQQKFIMKEFNLSKFDQEIQKLMSQEWNKLIKLKHPNIIYYYDFYIENNNAYIITEYLENGSLFHKIKEQKNKNFPFEEKVIIDWFIQICEGIKFINDKKINHKFLKSSKIFIADQNKIKIEFIDIYDLHQEKINNEKKDIYSLGVILYELTQLNYPFIDKTLIGKENNKKEKKFELTNQNYSNKLIDLIKQIVYQELDLNINQIILIIYSLIIKKNNIEE